MGRVNRRSKVLPQGKAFAGELHQFVSMTTDTKQLMTASSLLRDATASTAE
jgi:hypothetical protein